MFDFIFIWFLALFVVPNNILKKKKWKNGKLLFFYYFVYDSSDIVLLSLYIFFINFRNTILQWIK